MVALFSKISPWLLTKMLNRQRIHHGQPDQTHAEKDQTLFASSAELETDRRQFEIFINRKNKDWVNKGVFLELLIWEDFLDALSQTRLQDEYNRAIRTCDIFVMLFFTKVGKYTEEEFETAFGQFKKPTSPSSTPISRTRRLSMGALNDEVLSLLQFRKKLKALGHFQTVYNNIEDLQLQFGQQLDKLAASGCIEFQGDTDKPPAPSIHISHSKNVVAGSTVSTGGGNFIIGDSNSSKK